jgi:hypothetical protein
MSKRLNVEWLKQFNEARKVDPAFGDMGQDAYKKMRQVWFAGAAGALNVVVRERKSFTTSYASDRSLFEELRDECTDVYEEAEERAERKDDRERAFRSYASEAIRNCGLANCEDCEALRETMGEAPALPDKVCTMVHGSDDKSGLSSPVIRIGGKAYTALELGPDNPDVLESLLRAKDIVPIGESRVFTYWGPIEEPVKVTRTDETNFRVEEYLGGHRDILGEEPDDDDDIKTAYPHPDDEEPEEPDDDDSEELSPEQEEELESQFGRVMEQILSSIVNGGPSPAGTRIFRLK